MYVLISHHDPLELHQLATQILLLGGKVATTSDPARLLMKIDEAKPDLLLVGFRELNADAWHQITMLREHPSTSAVPLVMIWPAQKMNLYKQAVDAGCADFLISPFTRIDIDALITRFSR
jgi:PleD family two-component response regulator